MIWIEIGIVFVLKSGDDILHTINNTGIKCHTIGESSEETVGE
jgi:hypothetical protein